jgi:hypothetical protein
LRRAGPQVECYRWVSRQEGLVFGVPWGFLGGEKGEERGGDTEMSDVKEGLVSCPLLEYRTSSHIALQASTELTAAAAPAPTASTSAPAHPITRTIPKCALSGCTQQRKYRLANPPGGDYELGACGMGHLKDLEKQMRAVVV